MAFQAFTTEETLASLGYADPMDAARHQARMILLGRRAHYKAALGQLEAQLGCGLGEARTRYNARESEDAALDDSYLDWEWYSQALATVEAQLAALTTS